MNVSGVTVHDSSVTQKKKNNFNNYLWLLNSLILFYFISKLIYSIHVIATHIISFFPWNTKYVLQKIQLSFIKQIW